MPRTLLRQSAYLPFGLHFRPQLHPIKQLQLWGDTYKESHIPESYLCNNDARLTSGLPFGTAELYLNSRLLTLPTSKVAILISEFLYTESTTMSFDTEVLITGAGMSGLGMAVQLIRKFGVNSFQIIEESNDVGGTWLANTYPGCGCTNLPCYHMFFYNY